MEPIATDDVVTPAADTGRPAVDGRTLRRIRNRDRVIDAYLELVTRGNRSPSIDELAECSGVSFRSIYRYFEPPTEIVAAAARRGEELLRHHLVLADEGIGPLPERIERLVDQRLALHRRAAPYVVAARTAHSDDPTVRETLARWRETLFEQLGRHFAPEFAPLHPDLRARRQLEISVVFLHDSVEMLLDRSGGDEASVRSILFDHVARLFDGGPSRTS